MKEKKEKIKKVKVKKNKDGKLSLISKFKKNILAKKVTAFLFSVALLALFVLLNVLVAGTDLPEIDLTTNNYDDFGEFDKLIVEYKFTEYSKDGNVDKGSISQEITYQEAGYYDITENIYRY